MAWLRIVLLTLIFFLILVLGAGKSSKDESCFSSDGQPNGGPVSSSPEWILLQGNIVQQHDPFATTSRGLSAVDFSGDTDDVSDGEVEQLAQEVDDGISSLRKGLAAVDFSGDTDDVSDREVEQLAQEADDGISSLRKELGSEILDFPSLVKSTKSSRMLSMAAAPRSNLVLNAPDPDEGLIEVDGSAIFEQHPHGGHSAPPAPPPPPPAAPPPAAPPAAAHGPKPHGATPPAPPPPAHGPTAHGPIPHGSAPDPGVPPSPAVDEAPPPAHGAAPPPAHGAAKPASPAAPSLDINDQPPPTVHEAGHVDLQAPPDSLAAAPMPAPPAAPSHGGHGSPPAPAPKRKRIAAAPNAKLVREAIQKEAEKKALMASGDLHYTQHGCHCLVDWEYRGVKYKGCSATPGAEHTDHAWCKVTPGCEKHKSGEEEGDFDLCNVPGETDHHLTLHGCHCAPEWFWKDELYTGCGKTSMGPSWCYVFESDALCHGALRTEFHGQHWDYCSMEYEQSPILTKGGCHCQPEWIHSDGNHYKGCVESTPDRKGPWCYVFEDKDECLAGKEDEKTGRLWDECWLLDEAQLAALALTDGGCHCEPEWDHKGKTYQNCAQTPDRKAAWCYLLEDESMCTSFEGFGEGLEKNSRWDYCQTGEEPKLPGAAPTFKMEKGNQSSGGKGILPKNVWKNKDFPPEGGAWCHSSFHLIVGSILIGVLI